MKIFMQKSPLIIPLLIGILFGILVLFGAGCTRDESGRTYPPKPPIPGMQRSPAIERFAP